MLEKLKMWLKLQISRRLLTDEDMILDKKSHKNKMSRDI